ncbi:MAG: EamA family transporter, partial [Chloroflexi bacterium]|nr:EamA family transporter [Chloroflexota bacterium]
MAVPALDRQAARSADLRAYAALAIGTCCVSSSGIFVRLAGVPGPVAGLYRMTIAVLIIGVLVWRRGQPAGWTRRGVSVAVLAGMVFAGDVAAWNTSVFYTSIANASLLGNTAPLWVGLGAMILLRERLGLK